MKIYITKMSKINIITSLTFIIIGLLLIFKPATTLSMISYFLGSIILMNGIINLIKYFVNRNKVKMYDFSLLFGLISIIGSFIFLFKPGTIASIIPLLLGIWILINGIIKLQIAINLSNQPKSNWGRSVIISGINTLLGLFLVLNPFKGAVVITRIIGFISISYVILDLVQTRQIKKFVDDGVEFIK